MTIIRAWPSATTRFDGDKRRPMWLRARAIWVILCMNILWYLGVELPHGFYQAGYMASGALDGFDLQHGGWFRLLSSLFVHFTISHLVFNMVSLASMYVMEAILGWARFVCLYFVAGAVGGFVSVMVHPSAIYGGASGAIFGIFGAALWLSFKGVFNKRARNQLLFWLVLNVVLDLTQPNIGFIAHMCGLVVGVIGMWVLFHFPKWTQPIRMFAWGLTTLTGLSLLFALL